MTELVCDASVLVKLLISEADTARAESIVRSNDVIVPELAFAEVGNTIWAHARSKGIAPQAALLLLEALGRVPLDARPIRPYLASALSLAVQLDHPIYDCLYLALADSLNVPLITADQRFVRAFRRAGVPSIELKLLADFV